MKTNYISSTDLLNIIYTGVQNNERKKVTWKCEYCDAGTIHIHASSIGYCQRRVQYDLLKVKEKKFTSTTSAFLRDGHINEQIVREGLQGYAAEPNAPRKIEIIKAFNDKMTVNGVLYVVHKDFLVSIDGTLYVLEQKSVKDASFKTILRTHEVPYWYVDQLQIYLHHENLEYGFVIIKERSSTKMMAFPFKYDEKRVKKLFAKGSKIVKAINNNTLIEKPYKNFRERECAMPCQYFDICWHTGVGADATATPV